MAVDVQQITGTAYPIARLLGNSRYGLDFYQREYSWGETQVGELIDDLVARFLEEFDPTHERRYVASSGRTSWVRSSPLSATECATSLMASNASQRCRYC